MFGYETEKQKELFDDLEKGRAKTRFFKTNGLLQNKALFFQVPADKAVVVLIIVVIVAAAVFCAGVECGRRKVVSAGGPAAPSPAAVGHAGRRPLPAQQTPRPLPLLKAQPPAAPKPSTVVYAVCVASYKNKASAEAIAAKLKASGLPAYITKSKKHFVIYVGNYSDKKQAEAALAALKKKYKDSYIKQRGKV